MDQDRMKADENLPPFRARSHETMEMMAIQSQSRQKTDTGNAPDMLLPATD